RPGTTLAQFDSHIDRLQSTFRREREVADADSIFGNERLPELAEGIEGAAASVQSPLQRIEHALGPWVTFGIIPLFAFANAGVDFRGLDIASALTAPV